MAITVAQLRVSSLPRSLDHWHQHRLSRADGTEVKRELSPSTASQPWGQQRLWGSGCRPEHDAQPLIVGVMFRTFFVASIRPEQRKEVDIVCRFEAPPVAASSLQTSHQLRNLGTFCFPVGSVNVKPREYSAPEVCPMPMHSAGLPWASNCKLPLLTTSCARVSKQMRFAAGILLHTHRRRWQPHPWASAGGITRLLSTIAPPSGDMQSCLSSMCLPLQDVPSSQAACACQ